MSQVPATQSDNFGASGLDDFGVTDSVLPRISIGHLTGVWKDNLTNSEVKKLRFIPLGMVKQRVLFHTNVEDGDVPMCKSSDFKHGFPNLEAPRTKSFPWEKSGFDINDFPPINDEGQRTLPCDGCALKDWGSHPNGTNPYCSEQWTLPIYYDATTPDENGEVAVWQDEWTPAILTLQKSQLKPIKQYLTAFKSADRAPFTNIATATLQVITRGQVTYSVPKFMKGEESPRERWQEFNQQYVEMRDYLVRPPIRLDEPEVTTDNSYNQAPAQQAAPQQQAPVQQQPVQEQAPVQQQPAPQQAAPAQQDPWSGNPAPAEQAPPPQQQPVQQQPVQQQPAPQQQPPTQPGQGLPF